MLTERSATLFSVLPEAKPITAGKATAAMSASKLLSNAGLNRAAHEVIIKDISYNGFSVVSKEDLKLEVNQTVHAVLNDHMDETAENFNFHLYGLVARIQELENGLFLYGCRLNNPVPGLEQYIIKKERAVLRKRQSS